MNAFQHRAAHTTRRTFLRDSFLGLGGLALSDLMTAGAAPALRDDPLSPKEPHFAPKAKNVIFLHMSGGPPHLDLFDYKPELVKRTNQACPDEIMKGKRFAFTGNSAKLLGTPHRFAQRGQSGSWVSDVLPGIASIADDLTFIKSLHSDQFNHAPAELFLYTGSPRQGRPGLGSWVTYGLGSESKNLPGFIVLVSGGVLPSGGKSLWGSGFLPSVYQGVQCRSGGDPVLYVSDPEGMDRSLRRLSLDALRDLNEMQVQELGSPETVTRIAQYEMAYRMQVAVPEVMDITRETKETIQAYGAQPGAASFANNCLLARRLVEQGVRYVQLFDWGWDFHGTGPGEDIHKGLPGRCKPMDQAVTALIRDLKSRGMLEDTLVIWSGEFGRTPFREGRTAASANLGRDHHPHCYSMFMTGAGLKPGMSYGSSDDLGFFVGENGVHFHDLQATLLKLLGFDHTKLTYKFQGRDFRLTDVHGEVVKEILA
ncbi:MAG: DUF1501 domain-containing protein [Gemmataceae bacterium]|nr:DUF1501 domain-containing protein [Gemmataceae bacterium]